MNNIPEIDLPVYTAIARKDSKDLTFGTYIRSPFGKIFQYGWRSYRDNEDWFDIEEERRAIESGSHKIIGHEILLLDVLNWIVKNMKSYDECQHC